MFEFIFELSFVAVSGVSALVLAIILSTWILKQPEGNERVSGLSDEIYNGALTFLNSEYKPLSGFRNRSGRYTLPDRDT